MSGASKILVIGGGISGITAAVEAAAAGRDVLLVEQGPFLGGRVTQMKQYFPKLCPPACGQEISLRNLRQNPRIRCLTLTEVEALTGRPGAYQVTLKQRPRYINELCTACGACAAACPVERSDDFNLGLGRTKGVYMPFALATPQRYVIDESVCPGAACAKCVTACPCGAIDLKMTAQTIRAEVAAVVVATGWTPYDAARIEHLGFGKYRNVITNLMLERLAAAEGPTCGKIQRPSDGKGPATVVFAQCAGSRDENNLKHCSGVCCAASLKQVRYVREQYPQARIFVFYIDLRTPGRLEDFLAQTQKDPLVTFVKGKVARITEEAATGNLLVEAEDILSGRRMRQPADLVVLATGIAPAPAGAALDAQLTRDAHGFLTAEQAQAGLIPAGCARRPMEVAACVRSATGAVAQALQHGMG